MVVSVGSFAGLPEFGQIQQVLVVDTNILFICRQMFAWYHEHLRAYEVIKSGSSMLVTELKDYKRTQTLTSNIEL